ncbi:AraC family transcriptional regulator [Dictyobacter alpinus]|nr:AraC family transcriptional regulator [Dictyobacter alpinus]
MQRKEAQQVCWSISLKSPPKVMIIGTATHGEQALMEQYHSNVWVLLLFRYAGELAVDDYVLPVQPGYCGVFPPDATLTLHYQGRSTHHYAHLTLPGGRGEPEVPIAAITDLGTDFARFEEQYEAAICAYPGSPERTNMLLWDLLWQLTERTPIQQHASTTRHPALRRALELIELRLSDTIRIASLAEDVHISHRQLSNLFHDTLGTTITGYIRHRRIERAQMLLTQTNQPIKQIATAVGIPDLHHFNKIIRRELGDAPRRLRSLPASQAHLSSNSIFTQSQP